MWRLQNLLIILCSSLSCVTRASAMITVFGYEGRDVTVSCPYDRGYGKNEKYLCRNDCYDRDVLIETSQKKKNRYLIYDYKESRIFSVTISDLRHGDAGEYWCGVSRYGPDIYTEVKLVVMKDSCCDEVTKIQSHEGGSASITCPYQPENVNNLKFICRGKQPSSCLQQALVTSDRQNNGPIRLTDDRKSRTFTVSISNLTLEDSGLYLCGIQRKRGPDVFFAVELEVKDFCRETSSITRGIAGHPVTFQCSYPSHLIDKKKFLCKGDKHTNCTDMMTNQSKFTLHNISSSCFFVTITELEAEDAGTYYCGSDSQQSFQNYTKIQLAVVSLYETSTVSLITMTGPVTSSSSSSSSSPSSLSPLTDVTLFYLLPAVLVLLLILTFVLLMVFKNKSKKRQVDGVSMTVMYSADVDADVEMRINDIYDFQ